MAYVLILKTVELNETFFAHDNSSNCYYSNRSNCCHSNNSNCYYSKSSNNCYYLDKILGKISIGLGDNLILLKAHQLRVSFKTKPKKSIVNIKNAANQIVHHMEDKINQNGKYPVDAVSLLSQVQIKNLAMSVTDQNMVLIAHRVRSIIISNPSLHDTHKKYKNAANKIIHHIDFKKCPVKIVPEAEVEILLELFENSNFFSLFM